MTPAVVDIIKCMSISLDYDDEKHGHILELLEKMGHGTMSLEDSLKEKIAEVFQKQTETESRLSTIENLLAQIQDRIESSKSSFRKEE